MAEFTRRDFAWAAGTGFLGALIFATTLTGHSGLGDAPETIAGVSSLGVLHAPGYPAYVVAAKLFTLLVPFGSEAFRVNLFSLVCASLSVAGVQLLARRCGTSRWAASAAALCLASGTAFWFYATYAKHDMFSGLLFLIALHLVLAWLQRPVSVRLVWLAVAIGLGLGSSWPLAVLLLPAVLFALVAFRRDLSPRALAASIATGLVVVIAIYGFTMVRAAANPALNWGDATSLPRLVQLVNRFDFTYHEGPGATTAPPPSPRASASQVPSARADARPPRGDLTGAGAATITAATWGRVTGSVAGDVILFGRELGVAGLLLAGLGLGVGLLRWRSRATYVLMIVFTVNLIAAAAVVGAGAAPGPDVNVIEEGFLFGCYFVLACWLAIGLDALVEAVARTKLGLRLNLVIRPGTVVPVAAALLTAVLILLPVISHRSGAARASQPFADRYAASVFSELPPGSAVVIWGAELTQPLIYHQVVDHQRRDVVVVAGDGLSYDWYRGELERKLHRTLPPRVGVSTLDARQVVKWLSAIRPTYVDAYAGQLLVGANAAQKNVGPTFRYAPVGLLARVLTGSGSPVVSSPAQLDQTMTRAVQAAGFPDKQWQAWPNSHAASDSYSTAELEVARAYYARRDFGGVRRALLTDLSIDPNSTVAQADLQALARSQGSG